MRFVFFFTRRYFLRGITLTGMKSLVVGLTILGCLDVEIDGDLLPDSREPLRSDWAIRLESRRLSGSGRNGHFARDFVSPFQRGQQLHVQPDGPGDAVHRQVAQDISRLRARLFHTAALESDFRISCRIKKFRAAQMVVALANAGVDALDQNFRCDGRPFGCSRSTSTVPVHCVNFPLVVPRN